MKLDNVVLNEVKGQWGDELLENEIGTPVIKTNNMTYEGRLNLSELTYRKIPESKVPSSLLRYGDLLIEKSGGTKTHSVGYINIFEDENDKYVANNFILVLRPNTKKINPKYLFYQLRYKYESGQVEHLHNQTTGIQNLKVPLYLEQEIKYCSIERQQEIANTLENIEKLINLEESQISVLDSLTKSRFNEMFGNNTPKVKIGDILTTTSGGTPSKGKSEYYVNGDIPWLCSGEVNEGVITDVKNRITEQGLKNSSAKWIPENSVVVAMYGATAGKVGLLKIRTTTNQAVCSILPNEKFIPEYLYYAVGSKTEELVSKAWGGAQPNISQGIIKNTYIPFPEMDLQREFSSFVNQVDKLKFSA